MSRRRASISSAIAFFAKWFGSSCSDARGSFVVGLVLAPVASHCSMAHFSYVWPSAAITVLYHELHGFR